MIALYSIFAPFLVWPFELFFPYPFIVEELAKTVIVFFSLKTKGTFSQFLKTFILAGVLFALSETVLYLININFLGKISLIFTRFLATSLLHSFTFSVIAAIGFRNKKLLWLGFLIAAAIHYLYNFSLQ